MTDLHLTDIESEMLREALEHDISELRMEISNTDRQEYREKLKDKRDALARVLQNLEQHQKTYQT